MTIVEFEQRKNLIRQYPCFATLSDASVESLAAICFEKSYSSQAVILLESDIVDSFYLIANGEIEVDSKIVESGHVNHIPTAIIRKGEAIGLNQIGFFSPTGLRTATLTALSEVVLIGWSIDTFHQFLETHDECRQSMKASAEKMLKMNFIKQAAPFAELPQTAIEKLADTIDEISVTKGTVLFHQGDFADQCYLIVSGEIEILHKQADGSTKLLATLKPMQFFGETALISAPIRYATARVAKSAKLLPLKREQLDEVMASHHSSETVMALIIEHSLPIQASDVEHFHHKSDDNQAITILKDKRRNRYFQLSEEGWFVWQQLNGQNNLQDITTELYQVKEIFDPDFVVETVLNLADAGFVVFPEIATLNPPPGPAEALTRWQRYKATLQQWRYVSFIFNNIDPKLTATYRAGVYLFFTRVGQIILGSIALIGLVFFGLFLRTLHEQIPPLPHIFLLVVAVFLLHLLMSILHELAHAYTTKYYNHEVHRAGIILTWTGLVAFVDTSDMWLSQRIPRIMVSFAGPYLDLFLAGFSAIVAWIIPFPILALFFWLLALSLYFSVFKNLNPLKETDGTYILKDALNEPHIRVNALAWLRKLTFTRIPRSILIYWLICLAFLFIEIFLAFVAQHYLRLLLPQSLFGISTSLLLWILPSLVVLKFVFTILRMVRGKA